MQDLNTYKLLTPGPLTTSQTVREAMLVDRCTWDVNYNQMTQEIRSSLLKLAKVDEANYTTVLMQGSGTFGVESVLTSIPTDDDVVLVLVNGAYSKRMIEILEHARIKHLSIDFSWDDMPDATTLDLFLKSHSEVTHVAMVHNETTTGLINDLDSISKVVKAHNKVFIVDAMSSFGAVDINVGELGIDFIISSANKCIQGVPGFSFIVANKSLLEKSKGNARSLSLDLYDQWYIMEHQGGKWRYTSPTHVVAAFHQALKELEEQGGIKARGERYAETNKALREGMAALGFNAYIDEKKQGPIITTFLYPSDFKIDFAAMYDYLKQHGYVIYPGKLTSIQTFRLGNIGEIYMDDVQEILRLFKEFVKGVKAA